MQIIYNLLDGILIGIGVVVGMVGIIALFINKAKKSETEYDADLLKLAFETFLKKLQDDEHYELLQAVRAVIAELEKGIVPDLTAYRIKKDVTLWIDNKGGEKMAITFGKKYKIELK